jgi:hypothetical protein
VLAWLLPLHAAYAIFLVWRQSVVIDGERYFLLFDDAMVSMCYARSLAQGDGLVWHAGAPLVEGVTNLLWTLVMALPHLAGLADSKTSLVMQLIAVLLLGANLVFVHRLSLLLEPTKPRVALYATLLTALYLPLNAWGLLGTEVALQALLLTAACCSALRAIDRGTVSPVPWLLLGLGTWVRLDMAIPLAVLAAYLFLVDGRHRRRVVLWSLITVAVCIGGQTLFRLLYYGEWLPNTYHLKMTGIPRGLMLESGLHAVLAFLFRISLPVLAVAALPALRRRDRRAWLLVGLIGAQLAYVVWIGGDAWEWWGPDRFVVFVTPLLWVLLAVGLADLRRRALDWLGAPTHRALDIAIAALAALALVNVNIVRLPASGPLGELVGLRPLLNMGEHHEVARLSLTVEELTLPGASVAVAWAGIPIYLSGRAGVDLLGKSDAHVAGGPMQPVERYRPGHVKWDSAWSLGELRPDLIMQLWQPADADSRLVTEHYREVLTRAHGANGRFFLRKGSAEIRWERLGERAAPEDVRPDS